MYVPQGRVRCAHMNGVQLLYSRGFKIDLQAGSPPAKASPGSPNRVMLPAWIASNAEKIRASISLS